MLVGVNDRTHNAVLGKNEALIAWLLAGVRQLRGFRKEIKIPLR